jgi:ATP-dependent helicase Lhr and Lhr-like helicase
VFHPLIETWFRERFGEPTDPQRRGWPEIIAGRNVLIAAPTGSGKTLAAFLACLDRLYREALAGTLTEGVKVVYVSPLKALSNDIHRNLEVPLAELRQAAINAGLEPPQIRAVVRTGDTPTSVRAAMLRHPPHILVTTPESLYLLLTSSKSREILRSVETVIVDEIHALARDKRGSHLSITLERLDHLCGKRPVRIGLSATQAPIEEIGRFLVGQDRKQKAESRNLETVNAPEDSAFCLLPSALDCTIIDGGHQRQLDLGIEVPPSELEAVCSGEQWGEVYERLSQLIRAHHSTIVFVNTRKLAERVAHQLRQSLGEEAVAAHHGSLSREIRLGAEERLKRGELKAIVATASLEMGIDVGYIELVCQIGSPRSIATFLQRVGRSGHSLGVIPKGRLFPLTRDELIECIALVRAVKAGRLDKIEVPDAPLDLLAQQIVAMCANDEWSEDDLFELVTRASPYRNLPRKQFDRIVTMLSEGISPRSKAGSWLHRDAINRRLKARRGARIVAITCGGAIPELGDFRVVTENETFVGTVNEDFALESNIGDIFLLGNTSWRVNYVRGSEVHVTDAQGAPASIPFWLGEAPGRTIELSQEVSELREELESRVQGSGFGVQDKANENGVEPDLSAAVAWLQSDCNLNDHTATQAARYIAAQVVAVGLVPTMKRVLFERFFDESGGMQMVVHAPLGARINRAWGLAFRKRFCRSFDFELQASADEDGLVLSLGPQHSFPLDSMFNMLTPDNGRYLLEQALLAAPVFQTRWRWAATRSLAVLRNKHGKRVPPNLQRFRSDDLLAAVFPAQAGCLENHHGDTEIPDHPLIDQTMRDCMHEAMDVDRWLEVLADMRAGKIELVARDTREPSPFSHEILNANPYTFLDDAPLEERRARAVTLRRGLSFEAASDLGRLDPEAIAQIRAEAWPLVRDADELHDALQGMCLLRADEAPEWKLQFEELVAKGRATTVRVQGSGGGVQESADAPATKNGDSAFRLPPSAFWTVAERWPLIKSLYPSATAEPALTLPDTIRQDWESAEAIVTLIRGRMQTSGPVTAIELSEKLLLEPNRVFAALEAVEGEGTVMRGYFTGESTGRAVSVSDRSDATSTPPDANASGSPTEGADAHGSPEQCGRRHPAAQASRQLNIEWCERRLLARIHRKTLDGLRRQIQPAEPRDFIRFLMCWHHLSPGTHWHGRAGFRKALAQLQGFELAAGLWERRILPARCDKYDPTWLDELSMSGELAWGRLCPPKKDADDGPSSAVITRAAPISLLFRENLGWLLPRDRTSAEANCRGGAAAVLDALRQRGALFQHELMALTGLLPAQLDEALHELAALGLVTADAFTAVRTITGSSTDRRRMEKRRRLHRVRRQFTASPSGRWSQFPGIVAPVDDEQAVTSWAWQLLRRWGVAFRDVLQRESATPAWWRLVQVFRRLEARGEIRGGRFVRGVAGEQYALPEAVELLRGVRDEPADDKTIVLAAADPVNLCGLITEEPRVPITHTNTVAIRNGELVAHCQAGQTQWLSEPSSVEADELNRRLRLQYHVPEEELRTAASNA